MDFKSIDKLRAYIANNPTADSAKIINEATRLAKEYNINPYDLIDTSLGLTTAENKGVNLSGSLEDILNQTMDTSLPGDKYIVSSDAKSKLGLQKLKEINGRLGLQTSQIAGSREIPLEYLVANANSDIDKMKALANAGHELKHGEDGLIRANQKYNPKAYQKNHHAGDVYETSELSKQVRELEDDPKVKKELLSQMAKKGLSSGSGFKLLKSVAGALPMVGTAAGIAGLASGDASAAIPSPLGSLADSESLGAIEGSDESIVENPSYSPEERQSAMERIRQKYSK